MLNKYKAYRLSMINIMFYVKKVVLNNLGSAVFSSNDFIISQFLQDWTMRKLKNSELNRLNVDQFKGSTKIPLIVVLDNIRSLNNIGSVFRTADAFLIKKIYLCGITAKPPHKEIHKTALGATESVDWEYVEHTTDIVKRLQGDGIKVLSIEQAENSISLEQFEVSKEDSYAVIFGNEVKGVAQEVVNLTDHCIEIPQYGTKHSLNISVSCGIVLWDLFNKIKFQS